MPLATEWTISTYCKVWNLVRQTRHRDKYLKSIAVYQAYANSMVSFCSVVILQLQLVDLAHVEKRDATMFSLMQV